MPKKRKSGAPTSRGPKKSAATRASQTSSRTTTSGPSRTSSVVRDAASAKMTATEMVAEAFPFNAAKPSEYGKAAQTPQRGQSVEPPSPSFGASTLSEANSTRKTGKPAE